MASVLVIDDDADIRHVIADVLTAEGFSVIEAANGKDGLELLEAEHPAVVVLDLMMPVMNGWQFRHAQVERPAVADIPVIIVSANPDPDLSADVVLAKPFDLDALLKTVTEYATPEL